MPPRKTLVLGSHGQLGHALRSVLGDAPHIEFASRRDIDLGVTDLDSVRRWRDYDTIINAAAYTSVDAAETAEGRRAAWVANVSGVADLARVATANGITLVHVSSDYVFDGSLDRPYTEDDALTPLGVYGQTKAAGDAVVATVPRHYVLRTSWVVGEGQNFVRTMAALADRGVNPKVVADQSGRLTFASTIARAIAHLVRTGAPFGTYNITNDGEPTSWADVAREVFALRGADPRRITSVTTDDYFAGATTPIAARPRNSVLSLKKIRSVGLEVESASDMLRSYLTT